MLAHFHLCRRILHFSIENPLLLNSLTFALSTKRSSVSSAAKIEALQDRPTDSNNPVSQILSRLETLDYSVRFVSRDHYFGGLCSSLNSHQIDRFLENLSVYCSESALELFFLLRNRYGFRHSRFAQFVIAHVLAKKKRLRALRLLLEQLVQEEGRGSSTSLCELLRNSFRDWDSSSMIWDMLAFVYSRCEMIHDALSVLAMMKDLNVQASIITYNSLLYNMRHTDILRDMYSEIKDNATSRNEYTTSILIDGLCRQSFIQDAVAFLQNEPLPCVVSFNTIMSVFCKMGYVDVAKSIFCFMLKCGVVPDRFSYNTLIHGLCVSGSIEDALELASKMEKHGLEPNVVTYNILAKGFCLHGMINEAWKIIDEMLKKELKPDIFTFMIMICGQYQIGKIGKGFFKLREEMFAWGFQLTGISDLSSESGHIGGILSFVNEMETFGVKPDVIMYSSLIQGLCKKGELRKAIQLYNEMWLKKVFPNSYTHSAILLGLCEKGTISEAKIYFDSLTNIGIIKDIVLYNIMIDKYAKNGNIGQAVQLYKEIIQNGVTPNVVTFNSLIYGFCNSGRLAEARSWFDAIKTNGLAPSVVTYTILMHAFSVEGNVEAIFQMLQEMEASSVEPTHVTYTVIIKALCRKGKLNKSVRLLEDMFAMGKSPDQVSYNTVIQSFCRAGDIKKAFQLHDLMLQRNIQPDHVTYNILINGLCEYGDLKDADSLLLCLQETNASLTKVAYTTLIKAHCAKGDPRRAILVFSQMVDMGFDISIRDYSSVINRFCKRCLIHEAKVFLHLMICNGVYLDQEICSVLLHAFNQVGDINSIFELLTQMIKHGLDPELIPDS